MRKPISRLVIVFAVLLAAAPPSAGQGLPAGGASQHFVVTRNDEPIGTSTVRVRQDGDARVTELTTSLKVTIAFVTVYRYEKRQTERWVGGRLATVSAVTDDNGKVSRLSATRNGDRLVVDADGKISEIDTAVPANLWDPAVVRLTRALNTTDGSVIAVAASDRGWEQITVRGRPITAHRFALKTTMPHDVWYDQQRLVRAELRGSDGSVIRYEPG